MHIKNASLLLFGSLLSLHAASQKNSNSAGGIRLFTTAKDTKEFLSESKIQKGFENKKQPTEGEPCIFVDAGKTFQVITGIGGAITDASAETFARLSENKQEELLHAYYSREKGIGYSLARTNMNSCDFSSDTYTYVKENDVSLKSFDIAHDRKYKLPLLKKAMSTAKNELKLYISPWSPPAWMKDNNNMLRGGRLRREYYPSWANYYIRYINALEKEGIPVWGLSVQNEPMATQTWESCIYTAEEEADFIKTALGPALTAQKMRDKKLIIWDHNRDLIYQRASATLRDPEVAGYVWGIGYHWYETWSGGDMQFDNLKRTAEAFPDKNLIFTEGCKEKFSIDSIYNWSLGERYGSSMINDFNAGTVGWTDWNILLDENGGPNHVGNFCFAPVHADTKNDRLIYTNAFYYIGHFSRFVRPGAKRIIASSNRTDLLTTAFKNTDGTIAVIIMNNGDREWNYFLYTEGTAVEVNIPPHAIQTVMF